MEVSLVRGVRGLDSQELLQYCAFDDWESLVLRNP